MIEPKHLKPFWRYYGGKWRAAPRYPAPQYAHIVEPFAGSAGYSMRHYRQRVCLVEKYGVVAGIWHYLIRVASAEVERIPLVEHVDDLPGWVPQEARWLVGFSMNAACASPCKQLSSGRKKLRSMGRVFEGWSEQLRERVAYQVNFIRHWRVACADYQQMPNIEATWYVDPPYNNQAGSYYVHADVDYANLGAWCRERCGQVIVCENEGADWLPFRPFATLKAGVNGWGSREVIFTQP